MRFSVVIPTRDKVVYLRQALGSVLAQTHRDWECIVSDNASDEDVAGLVEGLGDSRIRYQRSDVHLGVTDSWNFAIDAVQGDVVLFLGNDDGFRPDHMQRLAETFARFSDVELVFSRHLRLAYPGVVPGEADGRLWICGLPAMFDGLGERRVLARGAAVAAVQQTMSLRAGFDTNLQCCAFAASLLDRLRFDGAFFQSPWPDFYAVAALLLESRLTVLDPAPTVVVGMSPNSMHDYVVNDRAAEGIDALLHNEDDYERLATRTLPGSVVNTSWQLSMLAVEERLGRRYDVAVDEHRYAAMQLAAVLRALLRHETGPSTLISLIRTVGPARSIPMLALAAVIAATTALRRPSSRAAALDELAQRMSPYPQHVFPAVAGAFRSLDDVVQAPPEALVGD